MYNSINLPLSRKKIVKKFLDSGAFSWSILLPFLLFGGFWAVAVIGDSGLSGMVFLKYVGLIELLILIVVGGFGLVYQYLYYRLYFYNFREDGAEIRKGVIAVSTGHVRYDRIQNIFVDQDILDRIFGLYDVHYETAGETSGLYSHVDGLPREHADTLVAFLNDRVLRKDSRDDNATGEMNELTNSTSTNDVQHDSREVSRNTFPISRRVIVAVVLRAFGGGFGWAILLVFFSVIRALGRENSSIGVSNIHGLVLAGGIFFAVAVGLGVVYALIRYIYMEIWYRNFFFRFDAESGVITRKVLAVKTTHVYYNRIQNIDIEQGFLERLLGIHSLVIETAAEGSAGNAISIDGLRREHADALRDFLLEKSKQYRRL